jgi:hypothetical protein
MADREGGLWPREGDLVFVDLFGPCLSDVEFLPGHHVQDLNLQWFYSRELAIRSLAHIRGRFPDAHLAVRRIPLDLSRVSDLEEYERHLRRAVQEGHWWPGARPAPAAKPAGGDAHAASA